MRETTISSSDGSAAARRTTPSARPGHPGWVLAVVALAQFMVVLDVSVVNVALPSIRADLGFSSNGLAWVVNAYALAFGGFLLLGGRAADLLGRRRIFLAGLALFTGASLLGGLAQTETQLVVARALQGLGGAVLSPATLTVLNTTFTAPAARARALGVWSAVAGAGGAAGALAGGVLTDLLSWRWILFVNVPIGVLALVAARLLLVESRNPDAGRLDIPGAVLVTLGLTGLVYGIVGTDTYGWASTRTVGTLVASVLVLVLFVVHQSRWSPAPLMPLGLLRLRQVAAANAVMMLLGAAIFATWYFESLFMQGVLGYSPLLTGVAFLPQTAGIIVGAQLSSRLLPRVGARALLLAGPALTAAGLAGLTRIEVGMAYWPGFAVPSVFVTFGMGLSFTPVAFAATAGVGHELAGLASGLVNTTRQVGGAVGLAALSTLTATLAGQAGGSAQVTMTSLTHGYAVAFAVAAGIALAAALTALALPGRRHPAAAHAPTGAAPGGPDKPATRDETAEMQTELDPA